MKKIRVLDTKVLFGFVAASEAAHHKLSKKDQRQIFEQLASTGANIETNADG